MLHPDSSCGYLTNLLARLFFRALDRKVQPLGLAHGQFPALLTLWNNPGLTQSELARRISIEQPTMANTLNRMERDGLIERRPDPNDRRRTLIFPAPAALAMRDEVMAKAMEVNAAALAGLSPEEQAQMLAGLRHMIGNLERATVQD